MSGENIKQRGASAHTAWELENVVVALGWPTGKIVGSERRLAARFGVSQETLREAVRIVERRGSMRMVRGRRGGLSIVRPDLQHTAAALAMHLRAIECTPEQIQEMMEMLAALMIRAA